MVDGLNAESLLMNLDIRGFSIGTGAACSSGNPEPSPVLLALGLSRDQAQSSVRVSLGRMTTSEQVEDFGNAMVEVVKHLRSLDPETGEVIHV
jgi:cysteine desulfurase